MSYILYQNASRTVTLLDLPQSISEASGVSSFSSLGPSQPFPSTEPKGSKRAKVLSLIPQDEQKYHEQLARLTATALKQVHQYIEQGKWCLDRTVPLMIRYGGDVTEKYVPQSNFTKGSVTPPLVLSALGNRYQSVATLQDTLVLNPATSAVRISVMDRSFVVPSHSTFLLSSIRQGLHVFETASQALGGFVGTTHPGLFDLILLDPPWPNRSVRNARVYNTSDRQDELHPFNETLPIINRYLSSSGVVAVWITNKRTIRERVQRSLRDMNLHLREEWIWLKITSYGEPVTALDGLWRKPYEVLLLFSCKNAVLGDQSELLEYPEVARRVILGVPDVHSRKPCVKELFKLLLPRDYRALEIFARNLTAGWWSWGDEVLKFNQEGVA